MTDQPLEELESTEEEDDVEAHSFETHEGSAPGDFIESAEKDDEA
jgi:hypothetical protein